jgi:hypothetical protein
MTSVAASEIAASLPKLSIRESLKNKELNMTIKHLVAVVLLVLMVISISTTTFSRNVLFALPDEAAMEMQPALFSTVGVITIYDVDSRQEVDFLDAVIKGGAFHHPYPGFTNERILQPLSTTADKGGFYISIGRYLDRESAFRVEQSKNAAIRSAVPARREPVSYTVRLVEHLLADWGWEKGRTANILSITPSSGARELKSDVFKQKLSSLAFFKIGYTGQVGMLDFFGKDKTVEQVRQEMSKREWMTGASIYETEDKELIVYSEYFSTPKTAAEQKLTSSDGKLSGYQAGRVVQNYMTR